MVGSSEEREHHRHGENQGEPKTMAATFFPLPRVVSRLVHDYFGENLFSTLGREASCAMLSWLLENLPGFLCRQQAIDLIIDNYNQTHDLSLVRHWVKQTKPDSRTLRILWTHAYNEEFTGLHLYLNLLIPHPMLYMVWKYHDATVDFGDDLECSCQSPKQYRLD